MAEEEVSNEHERVNLIVKTIKYQNLKSALIYITLVYGVVQVS